MMNEQQCMSTKLTACVWHFPLLTLLRKQKPSHDSQNTFHTVVPEGVPTPTGTTFKDVSERSKTTLAAPTRDTQLSCKMFDEPRG